LSSSGFRRGLERRFNLSSERNLKRLDLNVAALVNALTGANLRIDHIKRKSNHVKPTKFRGIEVKDPNE